MKLAQIVVAAVALFAATSTLAGGEHKPKYGGVLQKVGEMEYELVAKTDLITIYIEDHGKKIDTAGATSKVTLLTGKEKSDVPLMPAGGNKLEAKGTFNVKSGTKAVAVVTLKAKPPATARFVVP